MTKTDVMLIGSIKKLRTPSESDFSFDKIPVKQVSTLPWNTEEFIVVQ